MKRLILILSESQAHVRHARTIKTRASTVKHNAVGSKLNSGATFLVTRVKMGEKMDEEMTFIAADILADIHDTCVDILDT